MATVALYVVGSAIGTQIGGTIMGVAMSAIFASAGAAAGSYIDSQVIIPAIQGGPDGQDHVGPRLDDVHIQGMNEGELIKAIYGTHVRVAGTIIWLSDLREHEHRTTESVGGKGGRSSRVSNTTYIYRYDVAIGICRGPATVKRIWADTKLIYDESGVEYVGTNVSTVAHTTLVWDPTVLPFGAYVDETRMRVIVSSENLARYKLPAEITFSGFVNGGNNGTFEVRKVKLTSTGDWKIEVANSGAVTESAGASVTISAPEAAFSSKYKDITFYAGNESQTADALIETWEGANNVPGFRGTCYIVIEGFKIADFGNRLPQFSFEVEPTAAHDVGEAIEALCTDAGLSSGQYDATNVSTALEGFAVVALQPTARSIEQLMIAYDIVVQERDGVLFFANRVNPDTVAILEDDLGTHVFDDRTVDRFRITQQPALDLPRTVYLDYYDADNDFQKGTASAIRLNAAGLLARKINLPLSLTTAVANGMVKRMLWAEVGDRRRVELALPANYRHLLEGDVATVPFNGETYSVRVLRVDRGVDGLILVQGLIEEVETSIQDEIGYQLTPATQAMHVPAEIEEFILNLPPLRDEDAAVTRPGYYIALSRVDDTDNPWHGATLFQSTGEESVPIAVHTQTVESMVGETTDVLGDPETWHQWDEDSTVRVQFASTDRVPESISVAEAYAGKNVFLIGDEIVVAKTVTLVS